MKRRKSGIISGAPPVRSTIGMSVFASQSTIRSTVSRVMISLRFGPAFTWQCTQVRLQSLPTVSCKISGRPRRSESERSASLWANRFIVNQQQLRLSQQQKKSYHSVVAAWPAKGYTNGSLSILFYEKMLCRIYRHVRPVAQFHFVRRGLEAKLLKMQRLAALSQTESFTDEPPQYHSEAARRCAYLLQQPRGH